MSLAFLGSVRTARAVLNELKWREGRDLARAVLWVRGRTANDVKSLSGGEIVELGRRYLSTANATIPYYKGTWAGIRKVGEQPDLASRVTFLPLDKSRTS